MRSGARSELTILLADYIDALESPEVKKALARAHALDLADAYPPVDAHQLKP